MDLVVLGHLLRQVRRNMEFCSWFGHAVSEPDRSWPRLGPSGSPLLTATLTISVAPNAQQRHLQLQWYVQLHAHAVDELLPGALTLGVQFVELLDDPLCGVWGLVPGAQVHVGEEELHLGAQPFWVFAEQPHETSAQVLGAQLEADGVREQPGPAGTR